MATAENASQVEEGSHGRSGHGRRSGPFRFTIDQAYKITELGFFDDRRVELLDGIFYEMTLNPPHVVATGVIRDWLIRVFGAAYTILDGKPLDLGRKSHPEPDLAVVVGGPRDYSGSHPKTALLVVEVSDSTLKKDRGLKAHLYARAGLADYWIINVNDRQIEVHRDPGPDPSRRGRFRYREVTIVPAEGRLSPLARPDDFIGVADLLP